MSRRRETWLRRHRAVPRRPRTAGTLGTMWNLADRAMRAVADVTVGTVIVLVHVTLADRKAGRLPRREPRALAG
jgi:hypothetical protein